MYPNLGRKQVQRQNHRNQLTLANLLHLSVDHRLGLVFISTQFLKITVVISSCGISAPTCEHKT